MRNLLVTGGAGFIGSNFIHFILKTEPEVQVTNLDALTYAGSMENLNDLANPQRHTFVHGDICDAQLVVDLLVRQKIDTIVHFAAETHVDRSIDNPGLFVRTNIIGTQTLLEAARRYWLVEGALGQQQVHFHHVSTDEVFGDLAPDDPPWTEDTPYAPSSPYSASKAASDHLVRAYGHTYDLPYTITNCSNNYGPYQFPEKLIPLMISNLLEGKPLPVYGDGGQIRDWLYVEDHCEAIWMVIKSGQIGETYNIGGDNQPTNLTVVNTLCDIADELLPDSPHVPHHNLLQFVKDRPGHDRRYAMDSTKIRRELGWRPRHSLESGLLDTARWYMKYSDWITAVQQNSDYQQWIERNYKNREVQ
jgi:dTDP-glucose 4,6-dehydratase